MAKESIVDYSTTPDLNTDIGGIDIQGTAQRSNFDNAYREGMAQLAEHNAGTSYVHDTWTYADPGTPTKRFRFDGGGITAGNTRVITMPDFNGTLATLAGTETFQNKSFSMTTAGTIIEASSTDAGAASGPDIELYRNSATPAASDVIGSLLFYGKDSAANKQLYATIRTTVVDPVSTSEDGSLDFRTIAAGTFAERMHIRAGTYMEGATGGDKGTGTFNATALYKQGNAVGITTETEQLTTSGTAKDFTSIPAGVKRITIAISGQQSNGTSLPIIQIGDSGGIETSGYNGCTSGITNAAATAAFQNNTGFALATSKISTNGLRGVATLMALDNNTWVCSWVGAYADDDVQFNCAANKDLSGTLDRVRITTVSADTFTAGAVNIFYEF